MTVLAAAVAGIAAFPAPAWSINDLAVMPSGKILVASSQGTQVFTIAVLNAGGAPDTTFGGDGQIATRRGLSAAVQSDGKIVVAQLHGSQLWIYRYRRNGALDRSFSGPRSPGAIHILFRPAEPTGAQVIVGPGGEIVVAAVSNCPAAIRGCGGATSSVAELMRFDARGRPIHFGGGFHANDLTGLSLAPRHKVLAVGSDFDEGTDFAARFDRRGNPDQSFGGDGRVLLSGPDYADPTDVAAQADGRTVIAMNKGLVRLNPHGRADKSFGAGGLAGCPAPPPANQFDNPGSLAALEVQQDQSIVALGHGCGLVRFTPQGQVDQSFGTAGEVAVAGKFDDPDALALQPDGRIVVASWDRERRGFEVGRYLSAGTPDSSFGASGKAFVPVP